MYTITQESTTMGIMFAIRGLNGSMPADLK